MDLDNLDGDVLLGDGTEAAAPPSLLTSAPVVDLGFHPRLPILAAGLVTGEVEVYEYHGNEMSKKLLQNDFSSWIFGRNGVYREEDVALNYHHNNMLMHPAGAISALEFTDDGVYLVSTSSDRTISVLDCVASRLVIHITSDEIQNRTNSKKKLNRMNQKNPVGPLKQRKSVSTRKTQEGYTVSVNPHKYGISSMNVCDENSVVTGDDDGLISIWDMRARRPSHVYHEHGDYISQLCYFTDVQELVSSSGDTCLGVYDMRAGKVRDFSERRKDELSCFAFINSSGVNNASFIPSIVCGTPAGGLPLWKYGSWRRPYDVLEYHPKECESIVSFHADETTFNHNVVLTGACDGLVRVIQMYPLRRNLCQLSARDYSYSHANTLGVNGSSSNLHSSNYMVKRKRGQEGISRMRLSHDSNLLAVSGTDNVIDFVDIRFLNDETQLDQLRGNAEKRHMNTIRAMERESAAKAEMEQRLMDRQCEASDSDSSESGSDDSSKRGGSTSVSSTFLSCRGSGSDCDESDSGPQTKMAKVEKRITRRKVSDTACSEVTVPDAGRGEGSSVDYMAEYQLDRAKKRERVAAAKWLKEEKRKKINFTFEKRRRRVGGFFRDMMGGGGGD